MGGKGVDKGELSKELRNSSVLGKTTTAQNARLRPPRPAHPSPRYSPYPQPQSAAYAYPDDSPMHFCSPDLFSQYDDYAYSQSPALHRAFAISHPHSDYFFSPDLFSQYDDYAYSHSPALHRAFAISHPHSDYFNTPDLFSQYDDYAYSQSPALHRAFAISHPHSDYFNTPDMYTQSPGLHRAYAISHPHSQFANYSQSPMQPQSAYRHPQSQPAYYSQSPALHRAYAFSQMYPQERLRNLRKSISKQTEFSLSLAKHVISAQAKNANFVFSPLSMHIVLCMVTAGAGGLTRDQLLGYLKSKSVKELNSLSSQVATLLFADSGPLGGPRLSFANGFWVEQSLNMKPAFNEIVKNDYKAASNQVDFQNKAEQVREEVNAWAKKETNGLIKDLLPPGIVDSDTKLILANALYFKGAWAAIFNKSLTKDDNFFISNETSVRVPFMTSREKQCVRAFDGFKVLSLPYKQGGDNRRFSMCFYLPDAINGLPALVEKFGSIPRFIERHLPVEPVELGAFRVPKFKIEFDFEASEILKGQGLELPFSGGLTKMVDGPLMISKFVHKASIEVDEEGTEAAAASACLMRLGCSMYVQEKLDFVADHPFLFVIREDVSGGVLFVGQLVNPLLN